MKTIVPLIVAAVVLGTQAASILPINDANVEVVDQDRDPATSQAAPLISTADRGDYYQGANRPT